MAEYGLIRNEEPVCSDGISSDSGCAMLFLTLDGSYMEVTLELYAVELPNEATSEKIDSNVGGDTPSDFRMSAPTIDVDTSEGLVKVCMLDRPPSRRSSSVDG